MELKRDKTKQNKNSALDAFRQGREKGLMWYRFFALLVDFIIIATLYQLAVVFLGAPDIMDYMDLQEAVRGLAKDAPLVIERARIYQQCFVTVLAIGAAYEAVLLVLFDGSLGKLIFGFRVAPVNEERNAVLNKLMLVLRSAVRMLSIYLLTAIPFIILCLSALGNEEGRSGFDLCAGTRVIYRRRTNR